MFYSPGKRRRGVVRWLAIVVSVVVLAACDADADAESDTPPTTGADPHTELTGQWRYTTGVTPEGGRVKLVGTNAWIVLGNSGRTQGQDGLPWQGTYKTGEGWITLKATHRATLPLAADASKADRVASEITEKLLQGERVKLSGPDDNKLELTVDGYTLVLSAWQ